MDILDLLFALAASPMAILDLWLALATSPGTKIIGRAFLRMTIGAVFFVLAPDCAKPLVEFCIAMYTMQQFTNELLLSWPVTREHTETLETLETQAQEAWRCFPAP